MLPLASRHPVTDSRFRFVGRSPATARPGAERVHPTRIAGRRPRRGWPVAWLLAAAVLAALPSETTSQSTAAWPPASLRETGLYSDWESKSVSADHLPFSPQYPLWTDGATKRRWIHLPGGTWIDASTPDVWEFPVGTRIWKEFRFERRAETRFIERTREGWQFAAYAWNDDETEAPLAPARGLSRTVEIRPGVRHAIPSRTDCRACHEASPVRVLGFSALQLSSDRDPNAPHGEPVPAGGVDLPSLVARGLVRNLPAGFQTAPRIEADSATARAALGYLHANCGTCHVDSGAMASLRFALNYPLVPVGEFPPAVLTTVGQASKFRVQGDDGPGDRLVPGDPDRSILLARMSSRHPVMQMPPLGSRLVDEEAVRLVRQWIAGLGAHAPTAHKLSAPYGTEEKR